MSESSALTIAEENLRELLDATLLWAEDRAIDPGDVPSMYLKATIVQLFPEIVPTRDDCECGGECDECPTKEQVTQSIHEAKRVAQEYIRRRALAFVMDTANKEQSDE